MAQSIGCRAVRLPAGVMALWLLALALAAPIHELSHGSADHEAAAIEQCDFFVHQHQMATLLAHDSTQLAGAKPGTHLFEPCAPALRPVEPTHYLSRAPPLVS